MQRFLLRCGVAAPIIYVVTVLLGGLITPDYSHVSQAISELTATGAPHKLLLDIGFFSYNVAALLFAVGLLWRLWRYRRRQLAVGAVLLAGVALSGLLMYFAPMDLLDGPVTLAGQLHMALAAACSLLTILATLVTGLGFRGLHGWRAMGIYSVLSAGVIVVTGAMAAVGAAMGSPVLGIYERLTIGTFMLWMLVLALVAGWLVPQAQTPAEPQVPEGEPKEEQSV